MSWNNGLRCLVTGAAGFGGSHLCAMLVERGARVTGLDRLYPPASELGSGGSGPIRRVGGDVRDPKLLRELLVDLEIEMVFHLAAQPLVELSNQEPYETFSVNAMGTAAVLEAIRTTGNRCGLVFASSGAYYGASFDSAPIPESHPPLPAANIYAPSKVAADELVRTYARVFGTRAAVCRFMNTFGEGDTNLSRLIPRAASLMANGDPYDFGDRDDGSTRLDFLHVSDMSLAYLAVAANLDTVAGEAFNFGSGRARSVAEMVRLASLAYDGRVREPVFRGRPSLKPVVKTLEISKARQRLGWQPLLAVEPALGRTLSWYRNHFPSRLEGTIDPLELR